jgi:hypothetical protein
MYRNLARAFRLNSWRVLGNRAIDNTFTVGIERARSASKKALPISDNVHHWFTAMEYGGWSLGVRVNCDLAVGYHDIVHHARLTCWD